MLITVRYGCLSLLLALCCLTAKAAEGIKEDCDVVGKDISSEKADSAAQCREKCLAKPGCLAAGYISGWGRCFLRAEQKRTVAVRMVSGERTEAGFTVREQHDYSGKDFKKLALKSAVVCEEACKAEPVCQGFTFIGGYDTCWIKKTKGKLYPKIFYCLSKN
jgi:hypothetical protein